MILPKNIIIKDINNKKIIAVLNLQQLYNYIMKFVAQELSNLGEACYYPKVASIYQELLHLSNTDEKKLMEYSKEKYGEQRTQFKIVHDPYTTLLILLCQEFLNNNSVAGAQMCFHLFSLRTYTNTLRNFTTPKGSGNRQSICIPDVFNTALESLSRNHIFKSKQTISASIIYFSTYIFNRYKKDIQEDNSNNIFNMIYSLKNRIKQSIRSFMSKYYDIYKNKTTNKTKDEEQFDRTHETKLREFIDRITDDICIYRRKNNVFYDIAVKYTKFNKNLSKNYVECLMQPSMKDNLNKAYFLLLRNVGDYSMIKTTKFLDYVKQLMSIKTTKQVLYFKKVIDDIHLKIIEELHIQDWYNKLTIQSKAVGRNFIAYYLALYLRYYI
jgi:hypothetical protein